MTRETFLKQMGLATAAVLVSSLEGFAVTKDKKLKVALIGCGSVSGSYLPHLTRSKLIEIVSVCDIIFERAQTRAEEFKVPNAYRNVDEMLAGAPFDMMITTTDMQEHGWINKKGLMAGKHVWSEKPMANTYAEGKALADLAKSKNLHIWGAPAVVNSPQFAFMNKCIQEGKLGRLASGHGQYGHTGPTWSSFFYEKNGGSMPDLGVYNMATLTGLLGPARSIMAMTSIVNPERTIDGKGKIEVVAEDNAHILLEHDKGVISHVMCGFNFFDPHGHQAHNQQLHSIQIFGDKANLRLVGYDWETNGVYLDNSETEPAQLLATERGGYEWKEGATVMGESLLTGIKPKITTEHALHVLEIIEAARLSSATGKKISMKSTFTWPMM
jgi:predicted dehydrogenase